MQDHLCKLVSLLEHKDLVLQDLIAGQERFKDFLSQPQWSRFNEVTYPQEELLVKLQQLQAAQDYLMSELTRSLKVQKLSTLKALCRLVAPEWRAKLLPLIQTISEDVAQLQELSRLSAALNQAEWRFNRDWLTQTGQQVPVTDIYNARGYAHKTIYTQSCVSREV